MVSQELLEQFREKVQTASAVDFLPVSFRNGKPRRNKCRENVDSWLEEHPDHEPVRGWFVTSGFLLDQHSVIADQDGVLFDITPLAVPRPPFLRYWGAEDEFWQIPARIQLI